MHFIKHLSVPIFNWLLQHTYLMYICLVLEKYYFMGVVISTEIVTVSLKDMKPVYCTDKAVVGSQKYRYGQVCQRLSKILDSLAKNYVGEKQS